MRSFDLFVDLDQLESRRTGITLHKIDRTLRPISILDQMEVANAFNRMRVLVQKEKISGKEVYDAYFEIFSKIVEPFSKEDLDEMTQHKCAALYQTIEDHIMGRIPRGIVEDESSEKKKN